MNRIDCVLVALLILMAAPVIAALLGGPQVTNPHAPVLLDCTHPACGASTLADRRHVDNLTASGGWTCHRHDNSEVTP